jgi:hypothetical protein
MFTDTWRRHWGLDEAPFVHEDADKDPILLKTDDTAVHSSFDRVFGDPATPVPGVVFGEKGSGKSGLRLAIRRRVERHNQEHPERRVFAVDYIEFDTFLEELRRAAGITAGEAQTSAKVVEAHGLADHLDAVLSLTVTRLVDEVSADKQTARRFDARRRRDLVGLVALYYRSEDRTREEALRRLTGAVGYHAARPALLQVLRVTLTIAGVALALVPHAGALGLGALLPEDTGSDNLWYALGGGLVAFTWAWTAFAGLLLRARGGRAARAVRVVPGDGRTLARFLRGLGTAARRELPLPRDARDEGDRYLLLKRLLGVLDAAGYSGLHVLLDRVDESTFLAGREDLMRPYIEQLLQHKLLQHEGLALKLFLPIELSRLMLTASPDDLKRMRLDKANAVGELRWTGQELLEVANQRLRAASSLNGSSPRLTDLLDADVTEHDLRDALHELGTPRLCFGFLGSLFAEHARDLPEELAEDAPQWRVTRSRFDIQRAAWGDRARVLRRTMN